MTKEKSFRPPVAVARAAKKGLAFRLQYHRGGTAVGIARGHQLSNRDTVSHETIKRMYSFLLDTKWIKRARISATMRSPQTAISHGSCGVGMRADDGRQKSETN